MGRHEQEVQAVLIAIIPKDLDDRLKLPASLLDVALFAYVVLTKVFPLDLVSERRSQPVVFP